jgi:hypothetical protein
MAKKRAKNEKSAIQPARSAAVPAKLLEDLRELIQSTRAGVAQAVNSGQVLLYWQVGHRLYTETLGGNTRWVR